MLTEKHLDCGDCDLISSLALGRYIRGFHFILEAWRKLRSWRSTLLNTIKSSRTDQNFKDRYGFILGGTFLFVSLDSNCKTENV